MTQYSFLTEAASGVKSLVKRPARDPRINRVGDPREVIDNPDDPTNKMRQQATQLKAQAELIAAKAQLERTKHDADQSMKELEQQKADEAADAQQAQQQVQYQQNPMNQGA